MMTAKAKSKAGRGFTHFDVHGRPACGQGGTAIILSKDSATCMRCQKQYAYQMAMHRKRERESQSNQAGEVRHPRNRTRYKSLDRLAADPRVIEVWDEGPDGLWVTLAPGWNWDGASSLHEWRVRDLLARLREVAMHG